MTYEQELLKEIKALREMYEEILGENNKLKEQIRYYEEMIQSWKKTFNEIGDFGRK